jgi:hypothetical protein
VSLALAVVGCASPSLIPEPQSAAIKNRDRALAPHASAIHSTIAQSGKTGGLAFLDARDGRLVVLPGDSPFDAWASHTASPDASRVAVPAVVTFVHRADVPEAPETVTRSTLQEHQALRASVAALESDLRDAHRRLEERLTAVQRELTESIAATKQETEASLTAARRDMQSSLLAVAEDLATVRKVLLQTAQLGWLNHELNVENQSGIRKMAAASQELSASSTRLEETVHQLSERLAGQLKELAKRLDAIQSKFSNIK